MTSYYNGKKNLMYPRLVKLNCHQLYAHILRAPLFHYFLFWVPNRPELVLGVVKIMGYMY